MIQLYHAILYQPIYNALIFLYNIMPGNDIGLAIIILTVLIKLILFPFSLQSIRSQKALQELQPKIEELKKQYKDKKEEMAKAMMGLYKKEKVNPFSSCLPLLIQLPFLIAVFQVFRTGLSSEQHLDFLYPFISNPGSIDSISLGIIDLATPSLVLAVLAGLAQFFQTKMLTAKRPPAKLREKEGAKDEDMAAVMNKQMTYFMPVVTVIIGTGLPGGLTLYWLITTLLTIAQQLIFVRKPQVSEEEGVIVK